MLLLWYILLRSGNICNCNGLFRQMPALSQTLKCSGDFIINEFRGDFNKKKKMPSSLRKIESGDMEIDYEKEMFKKYDYTGIQEKISLPLKTRNGVIIDDTFLRDLESIHKWCQKPSSLSKIVVFGSNSSSVELHLSFNEVLFHVLEGFGSHELFIITPMKSKTTNEMDNVSDNQPLHKPYETLMIKGSPIYAEISENTDLEGINNRGK